MNMFAKSRIILVLSLLCTLVLTACGSTQSTASAVPAAEAAVRAAPPQQATAEAVSPDEATAEAARPKPTSTPKPTQPPDTGDYDLTKDAPFTGLEYKAAPEPVRPDIPLVVNQPAPSDVNPAFLGPVKLIKSAVIDEKTGTATVPLHEGRMASGESVWYIITDVSDEGIAELLGLNYSRKLIYADIERGVRHATVDGNGTVVFERGKVDFAPKWSVTPGKAPNFFPPAAAQPGSVGDDFYTPLFQLQNGAGTVIYNAPVLAYNVTADQLNAMCDGNPNFDIVHDKVAKICPRDRTATVQLTLGYSFAKPIWYASFDANNPVAATLEKSTLTPVYDKLGIRLEDAAVGSGEERLLIVTNGPTGRDNPDRQGLNSALSDGRDPINVFGGIPTYNLDYSPLWDVMFLTWSPKAIERGYNTRLIDAFHALQYETRGYITSPEGGRVGSSGIIINCPIFMRFN